MSILDNKVLFWCVYEAVHSLRGEDSQLFFEYFRIFISQCNNATWNFCIFKTPTQGDKSKSEREGVECLFAIIKFGLTNARILGAVCGSLASK